MIRLTDEQWERIRDPHNASESFAHFPEENIADGPPGQDVANEFCDRGALNEEQCFIDATFVMAGGGLEIGATKRGKGMKIMAIVAPWIAAFGQHARGEPSRSAFGFEPREPWSTTYRISSVGRERPWLNLSSGGRCTKYSAMREGATEDGRAYDATHVRRASRLISDGRV